MKARTAQLSLLVVVLSVGCRQSERRVTADDVQSAMTDAGDVTATLIVDCARYEFEVGSVTVFAPRDADGGTPLSGKVCEWRDPRYREASFALPPGRYRVRFADSDTQRFGGTISADDEIYLAPRAVLRWTPKYIWRGKPYPTAQSTAVP